MDPIQRIDLIENAIINQSANLQDQLDTIKNQVAANEIYNLAQLDVLKTEIIPVPPPDPMIVSLTASPNGVVIEGTQITLTATEINGIDPVTFRYFRNNQLITKTDTPPVGVATYNVEASDSSVPPQVVWSNNVNVEVRAIVPPPGTLVKGLRNLRNFTLPSKANERKSYAYGGHGMSIKNGKLWIDGFAEESVVGQLTIPASGGGQLSEIQFGDPFNGQIRKIINGESGRIDTGGTLEWNDKLVVSACAFYDNNAGQHPLTHFVRPVQLSNTSNLVGPVRAGNLMGSFYNMYMGYIPSDWQSKLGGPALTGAACLNIISRTSYGPAAFSFDPDRIGSAQPLVYYPEAHRTLGNWEDNPPSPFYGMADQVTGVAIIPGTRSLLFGGRHGTTSCYGSSPSPCNDPSSTNKGTHGYPYLPVVWVYDLDEMVGVVNGSRQAWSVIPKSMITIPGISSSGNEIMGLTVNPDNGKIFVSLAYGDSPKPRIYELEATY